MVLSSNPRLFVDFTNLDDLGRVRPNCTGTFEDLDQQGILLEAGLTVHLYNGDVTAEGTVAYSKEEGVRVARLDTKPSVHPA